jgi:Glycosyltransferase family 87
VLSGAAGGRVLYYLFCLVSTAASVWLLRLGALVHRGGADRPGAMWNLYLGQFGLLFGALLIAGLAAMQTKPLYGGGLLGALCIKPQYALLVPVVVCAGRHWRALLAGIAAVLALLASPYGFTDDLAAYSLMLPTLTRRDTPWRNAALAWLWVAPALVPKFVAIFGFLPTPLLLLAAISLAGPGLGTELSPARHAASLT